MDKPIIHLIIIELTFQSWYPCILLHSPEELTANTLRVASRTPFVYSPVNLDLGIMDLVYEPYEA